MLTSSGKISIGFALVICEAYSHFAAVLTHEATCKDYVIIGQMGDRCGTQQHFKLDIESAGLPYGTFTVHIYGQQTTDENDPDRALVYDSKLQLIEPSCNG